MNDAFAWLNNDSVMRSLLTKQVEVEGAARYEREKEEFAQWLDEKMVASWWERWKEVVHRHIAQPSPMMELIKKHEGSNVRPTYFHMEDDMITPENSGAPTRPALTEGDVLIDKEDGEMYRLVEESCEEDRWFCTVLADGSGVNLSRSKLMGMTHVSAKRHAETTEPEVKSGCVDTFRKAFEKAKALEITWEQIKTFLPDINEPKSVEVSQCCGDYKFSFKFADGTLTERRITNEEMISILRLS